MPCCNAVSFGSEEAEGKTDAVIDEDTDSRALAFFAGRTNLSSADIRGFNGLGFEMFNTVPLLDFGPTFIFCLSRLFFLDFFLSSFVLPLSPAMLFNFLSMLISRAW